MRVCQEGWQTWGHGHQRGTKFDVALNEVWCGEGKYVVTAPTEQAYRQLFAQYPTKEAISRSSIMVCFDEEQTKVINQMWINVRCYNIHDIPGWVWAFLWALILAGAGGGIRRWKGSYRGWGQ